MDLLCVPALLPALPSMFPPGLNDNFPEQCYTKDWEAEAGETPEERRQERWEKPTVVIAPLYMPFYTQVVFPSVLPGYSASPCKECNQLGKYWADFLNQAKTNKKNVCQLTSPNTDHSSDSIFTCILNPICFQCNSLQEYRQEYYRRV